MQISITLGAAHRKHINRLNRRQVRKLASSALYTACRKMKKQKIKPLCCVDDLTIHSLGSWIDDFAIGLTNAALRKGVSIIGGEMAQMPDSYKPGYVGVVVYVTGIKESSS